MLVLLLAWIVQFGAQLCALHCPPVTAGADAPAAVAVVLAEDAVRSLPGAAPDCPLADVCDLGQTALLPFDRRPVQRIAAADELSAPPARVARFERAPEERPPTA